MSPLYPMYFDIAFIQDSGQNWAPRNLFHNDLSLEMFARSFGSLATDSYMRVEFGRVIIEPIFGEKQGFDEVMEISHQSLQSACYTYAGT